MECRLCNRIFIHLCKIGLFILKIMKLKIWLMNLRVGQLWGKINIWTMVNLYNMKNKCNNNRECLKNQDRVIFLRWLYRINSIRTQTFNTTKAKIKNSWTSRKLQWRNLWTISLTLELPKVQRRRDILMEIEEIVCCNI